MNHRFLASSLSKFAVIGLSALVVAIAGCQSSPVSEAPTDTATPTAEAPAAEAETAAVQEPAPLRVGEPAPDFTGTDSNGNTQTLSAYKGKVVVLEWTNHECPYVRKHYESGNMQALQKEITGQDVVWLSVVSSAPGMQGHVDAEKANQLTTDRTASPTAVILDEEGTIGKLYGARTTPHMYVIDGEGVLQYAGAIDDKPTAEKADVEGAQNYVREAVTSIVAGQPVATTSTQPYGCSVKYEG